MFSETSRRCQQNVTRVWNIKSIQVSVHRSNTTKPNIFLFIIHKYVTSAGLKWQKMRLLVFSYTLAFKKHAYL